MCVSIDEVTLNYSIIGERSKKSQCTLFLLEGNKIMGITMLPTAAVRM